jgi:serine/threonine protein kinase
MAELSVEEAEAFGSPALIDSPRSIGSERYTLQSVIGRGKKGVVWRAANAVGAPRAVKLAVALDYEDAPPLRELLRASVLEPYGCFARLERVEFVELDGVRAAALVSEWVEGLTLETILESHQDQVSPDFIRSYIFGISDALGALRANNLCHDDLNFGNVMAADPLPGLKEPMVQFKVVDLGSLKPLDQHDSTKKAGIDDYRWVALHLAAMHNVARLRYDLSPREREFLENLTGIVRSLLEDDPVTRLADPISLSEQVEQAWARSGAANSRAVSRPFEYISADQIADDAVLLELFADSLPWLDRVNSATRQIVTGPRGCGKSTVFRWLALRTHIHSGSGEAPKAQLPDIAGFYVSAGVELQSRLGWIRSSELAGRLAPEIIHLFNLILIREVVKVLAQVTEKPAIGIPLTLTTPDGALIRRHVEEQVLFEQVPLFQGVASLRQLSRQLNRHIFDTHQRIVASKLTHRPRSTAASLPEFTELLRTTVPYFQSHQIVFLVDDFSTHRVPKEVQEVLHDVVWLRAASHSFKLSAEKNGVHIATHGGRTAELAREYTEVDCGAIMLEEASSTAVHNFAVQLLDMRLKACGYAADATTLLGESSWVTTAPPNNLARFLWEFRHQGSGQKPASYYGTKCIADLCSGDVAALLLIFENIFRKGKVRRPLRSWSQPRSRTMRSWLSPVSWSHSCVTTTDWGASSTTSQIGLGCSWPRCFVRRPSKVHGRSPSRFLGSRSTDTPRRCLLSRPMQVRATSLMSFCAGLF